YRATELMKRATEVLSNAVNNQIQDLEGAAHYYKQYQSLSGIVSSVSRSPNLNQDTRDKLGRMLEAAGNHFVNGDLINAVDTFKEARTIYEQASGKKLNPQ